MILVTRKAVDGLKSWPLTEPAKVFEALTELKDEGWEGAIDSTTWSIRLSSSGKNSVNAQLGQCLVLDGDLRVFGSVAALEIYEFSEPVEFPTPEPEPTPDPEPVPQTSPDTSVPMTRTVR